jgi:hypothetical protein
VSIIYDWPCPSSESIVTIENRAALFNAVSSKLIVDLRLEKESNLKLPSDLEKLEQARRGTVA